MAVGMNWNEQDPIPELDCVLQQFFFPPCSVFESCCFFEVLTCHRYSFFPFGQFDVAFWSQLLCRKKSKNKENQNPEHEVEKTKREKNFTSHRCRQIESDGFAICFS